MIKFVINKFRGLFLLLFSSAQLQFILFFLISIISLEVYADGVETVIASRTIGYILQLSGVLCLLCLGYFILSRLFKRVLPNGVVSQKKVLIGVGLQRVLILIVVMFLSSLRIYVDLNQEISFRDYEFCSTESECNFELYVVEEPKQYHEYLRLKMGGLQDVIGGFDISAPRSMDIAIGTVCNVTGELQAPENFDDFDYVSYLRRQRIYFTIPFPKIECYSLSERREGNKIRNWLVDMKGGLIETLENNIPEPQVSLLAGILFGERRLFEDNFDNALKATGTTHIVAASGYNVTILILLVEKLFRLLNNKWRIVASIAVIWCFCLLSGLSPSIVRATIMGSLFLLSKLLGNKASIHSVFLMSIAIFLFIDPRILFSIGFQFSVLSVAGLIYLAPVLEIVVLKVFPKFLHRFIKEYFIGTLSCTLLVLPLSVYVFGKLSYISVLANMLILPVLESTMLLGVVGLLATFLSSVVGNMLLLVSWFQLKYFEVIVLRLSSIPGVVFVVDMGNVPIVLILIYLLLFILIVLFYPDDGENYYLSRNSLERVS